MTKYDFNTFKVSIDSDGIALVQFNRPEALNAANEEMSYERLDLFKSLDKDESVKVVIITGNERAYCAGGDLKLFSKFSEDDALAFGKRGLDYQNTLMNLSKPTISAVSGYAFGGGFENVLLCDLRIATKSARFSFSEINVGIFPGGGGTQRLVQNISICQAKELIFTGKRINAEEALDLGLINKVVDDYDELMDVSYDLARELIKKPPISLKYAKQMVNHAWGRKTEEGALYEVLKWAKVYDTEDQKEGMQAFLEKRDPEYKGK